MAAKGEERDGVPLTNLDQELFPDAGATKRDLVDYLDAVRDRILPVLRDRPLSVVRVLRGQDKFMQKNLPKYTPDWVQRTEVWAEASHRQVSYALCNDRRTLLWFGNQRAVEYHPTLMLAGQYHPTHLIMDLDPPEGGDFSLAVGAARLVHAGAGRRRHGQRGEDQRVQGSARLRAAGRLRRRSRTWPPRPGRSRPAPNGSTRSWPPPRSSARTGTARSSSTRPGPAARRWSPRTARGSGRASRCPSRWPGTIWTTSTPADFTVRTAPGLLGDGDPWAEAMPGPQKLDPGLVEEGHTIPIARVQAMHEGKRRRAKARATESDDSKTDRGPARLAGATCTTAEHSLGDRLYTDRCSP